MRIFPYTLRITGYSRAPAAWPARPKIHFAGESCLDVAPAAMAPIADAPVLRGLSGTVQMAASGDVHWSIVRHLIFLLPGLFLFPCFLEGGGGRGGKGLRSAETDAWIDFWGLILCARACVCSNASARTRRSDGPARPCRSAGAARPWASSVSGPTRSTG